MKSGGPTPHRGLVWALYILVLCCSVPSASSETIALGQRDWEGSRAITHVLKVILETRLGHQARIVPSDDATIFAAMHEGKGEIDVLTDLWKLNQLDQWAKYVEGHQSVLVNEEPYIGQQGLFVPAYIPENEIRHVRDLANPDIAQQFDSDSDGKGEYWPGALGWTSTHVEQIKAQSYGYDKFFKPVITSDRDFKIKLQAALDKKEWVLFYYWTPEWIHEAYELRQLKEEQFDGFAMSSKKDDPRYKANGCWNMVLPRESEHWLEKSRITCAWPKAEVYVAFSASLRKRAPDVATFLEQVAFTDKMLNFWILQIGKKGRDPAKVAKEWVKAHPEDVERWLANTRP